MTRALIETVPGKGYRFLGAVQLRRRASGSPLGGDRGRRTRAVRTRPADEEDCKRRLRRRSTGNASLCVSPARPEWAKRLSCNAFLQGVRRTSAARIGRGQCLENRGEVEPYIAVLDALGRLCREPDGDEVVSLLYRRAPTWLAQMPWLASAPALAQLPQRNLGVTRDRMLREFAELVEELTFVPPARPLPR